MNTDQESHDSAKRDIQSLTLSETPSDWYVREGFQTKQDSTSVFIRGSNSKFRCSP